MMEGKRRMAEQSYVSIYFAVPRWEGKLQLAVMSLLEADYLGTSLTGAFKVLNHCLVVAKLLHSGHYAGT